MVTISELIALLQCSRPKGRAYRRPQELRQQVAYDVHQDLAGIQQELLELKQGIRVAHKQVMCVEESREVPQEGPKGWETRFSLSTEV